MYYVFILACVRNKRPRGGGGGWGREWVSKAALPYIDPNIGHRHV